MYLTPEQRKTGADNYYEALGISRREFLQQSVLAGVVSGASLGAMYFGYDKIANPVRVGVIGTGDEGNVLIGACNPEYVDVVAISDIRPSSIHRAFHGDYRSDGTPVEPRPGLMKVYGWKTEAEARQHVKVYGDYTELIAHAKKDGVEAVIIALPLHLHAASSIAAMEAGLHVLCEKLMAHTVMACKEMARAAAQFDKVLSIGHQRHYSILYDNAVNLIRGYFLGELHHIRAQWHRNNLPGADSWSMPVPGGEIDWQGTLVDRIRSQYNSLKRRADAEKDPQRKIWLDATVAQWAAWLKDAEIPVKDFGYEDMKLPDGRDRSAMNELVRWRIWERTGGGLMAELGSHQLDASGIFISALRKDGKKALPIAMQAFGGRNTFPLDREVADHIYCMYEYPAPGYDSPCPGETDPNKIREACMRRFGYYDPILGYPKDGIPPYEKDSNKRVVVTYSTINGNGFGGYGEIVKGTKRTMVVDREEEVMLFDNRDTTASVDVKAQDEVVIDTQASGPAAAVAQAATGGPVSRGYREQIEHFAYCIRNRSPENQVKCGPKVGLADAVIALTTKIGMRRAEAAMQQSDPRTANRSPGGFVMFDPEWFEVDSNRTPEEDLA